MSGNKFELNAEKTLFLVMGTRRRLGALTEQLQVAQNLIRWTEEITGQLLLDMAYSKIAIHERHMEYLEKHQWGQTMGLSVMEQYITSTSQIN